MEFRDGEVIIEKPVNELDQLILDVADVLSALEITYVVVSGYIAVLFGRARATEDIDVLVESFDEATATALADELRSAGYWGPAMPLDACYTTLSDGLPVRIAEENHRVPNVELKFATDEYDRASLSDTVTVRFDGEKLRIASIELQIAYKLSMGAQKDFEDALYLYEVADTNLKTGRLEAYVKRLGVEEEYERLRRS